MKLPYLIILLCVGMLGAFSCSKKAGMAKVDKSVNGEKVEEILEEEVEVEIDAPKEEVYVLCEIQRSACYGKCPSYSIKLYADGKVIYHGKANVDKIGYHEAFCDPRNFEAIFTAAAQADYFVLRSQYPTDGRNLPDLPKTTTYLKRDGLEKRVIDNFDAPASLVHFENWLDGFFNGLEWKKVDNVRE